MDSCHCVEGVLEGKFILCKRREACRKVRSKGLIRRINKSQIPHMLRLTIPRMSTSDRNPLDQPVPKVSPRHTTPLTYCHLFVQLSTRQERRINPLLSTFLHSSLILHKGIIRASLHAHERLHGFVPLSIVPLRSAVHNNSCN